MLGKVNRRALTVAMKARIFTLLSLIVAIALLAPGGARPTVAQPQPAAPVAPALSEVDGSPTALDPDRVAAALQSTPVMFVENVGQFDERAHFQVRGGSGTMWLAEDGLWVTVMERPTPTRSAPEGEGRAWPTRPGSDWESRLGDEGEPRRGVHFKLSFVGANPHSRIEPFDHLDTVVSYFIGNDPEQCRPDVPVWGGVRYVDLYAGVDLVVGAGVGPAQGRAQGARLPWRLEVREGADLSAVRLRVEGADTLTLDSDRLRLTTALGDFTLPLLTVEGAMPDGQPITFNVEPGTFDVVFPFSLSPDPFVSLSPQDNPDDLLYSTFLGGSSRDDGYAIAVDGAGCAYVAGWTYSLDFPTTAGAFDTNLGYTDGFVVKLNAGGTGLVYATFLGGSDSEGAHAIALDGAGSAYVTGETHSSDFPTTPGALDTSLGGDWDAFVVKVNASGTALTYATFLGGSSNDWAVGIAVDGAGTAYVTGPTYSSDFPTTAGAFDTSNNGSKDAFVVKVNPTGTALTYATFLGGSSWDDGRAIAVDGAGSAYVTGHTYSYDFPTTAGVFDTSYNDYTDAFVVKLNAAGTGLAYATFLGGSDSDYGYGIAVDGAGSAYVTGYTYSSDFPTTVGAFDTSLGGDWDAFVVKVNASGTALTYATFLGGSSWDDGRAIAVDGAGSAYVTGHTYSYDFPTTAGVFDTSYNDYTDAFVVKLNAAGTGLAYATFLGGSDSDYGYGIAVDGAGSAYVAGRTYSSDFPTTAGSFDTSHNGYIDAFVAKLAARGGPVPTPTPMSTATFTPVRTPTSTATSTPVPTPTPTFTPMPTPADLELSSLNWYPEPVAFAPFYLKLVIENVGSMRYEPLDGHYTVEITFEDMPPLPGTVKFLFDSEDSESAQRLNPSRLRALNPGESQVVTVSDIRFPSALRGQLEVKLIPRHNDSNLGNNSYETEFSVAETPHGWLYCVMFALRAVIHTITAPLGPVEGAILGTISNRFIALQRDIALLCEGNLTCVANEIADFLSFAANNIMLGPGQSIVEWILQQVRSIIDALLDVWRCVSWIWHFISELLARLVGRGVDVNGVTVESPAYILVEDTQGRRVGFLDDGTVVQEIEGAQVWSRDGTKFVLYPGTDTYVVRVKATGDGTLDLKFALSKGEAVAVKVEYLDLPVTSAMVGTVDAQDEDYIMDVDENGDGVVDSTRSPDSIRIVKPYTVYLPLILKNYP